MLPNAAWTVLGTWLALGLAFAGAGVLACRALGSSCAGVEGRLRAFWLGWVAMLFALQLWHLAFAVNRWALAATAAAGLVGLAVGGVPRPALDLGRAARAVLPLAAFLVLAVWLATRALDGPRHGDSGAYFVPTVRWVAAYPIVPGLANLFVPFGFNQSYFLYVAMLDVGPFAHRSYHVANGLLVLALVARGLLAVHRLLWTSGPRPPADVFYALFLPVVLAYGEGIFLTSPSPDAAVFLLGVVVSGELVALLTREGSAPAPDPDALALALLAAGGITVKLSFAGLAAGVLAVVGIVSIVRAWPRWRDGARTLAGMIAVAALGIGPWIARNIVLSGRPFYPSGVGAVPVEWLTDADAVQWIKAPMQFGLWFWQALGQPRWFLTRLDSLGWLERDVIVPAAVALGAAVLGLLAGGVRILRRRPRTGERVPAALLVPAAASLVFVASTAPMPHYAGATFWLLAVGMVLLVVHRIGWMRGAVIAGAVVLASGLVVAADRPFLRQLADFAPAPPARFTETHLPSGLLVRVPEYGQCWQAPLPCSPAPPATLRLRRPDDLGSGFVLDRSLATP